MVYLGWNLISAASDVHDLGKSLYFHGSQFSHPARLVTMVTLSLMPKDEFDSQMVSSMQVHFVNCNGE